MSENGTGDQGNGAGRPIYTTAEFALRIKVSRRTLYTWDQKGLLVAMRYPSGRPFYTQDQLEAVLQKSPAESPSVTPPPESAAPAAPQES